MMLLLILCTFPLKAYIEASGGLGVYHNLTERRDAPYQLNPSITLDGVIGGEFGLNLFSIVNLTCFGEMSLSLPSNHPMDKDKKGRRDTWEAFSFGGKVSITLPIKGNLFGKASTKYGKIAERCTQVDKSLYLEKFFHEEYEYLGCWPEFSLLFNIPEADGKEWGQLELLYEYQDLGTITLEEKVSGKTYYEKLVINKFYFGLNSPAIIVRNKDTGIGRGGLGISLTHKSDGRTDVFALLRFKVIPSFTSSDTVFTNRF